MNKFEIRYITIPILLFLPIIPGVVLGLIKIENLLSWISSPLILWSYLGITGLVLTEVFPQKGIGFRLFKLFLTLLVITFILIANLAGLFVLGFNA